MKDLIEKAIKTHSLTKEEIVILLKEDGVSLFKAADTERKKYKGDSVHLRGLLEFTNICKQNCYYCGLRSENKKLERYRLSSEQIIECAKQAKESGYKTIVLQGGEDVYFDSDKICQIIREIKKLDLALTLSIGERTKDEYKAFRTEGADRYLIRIETTDRALYKKLHPNMDFNNRLNCLYTIKSLGYETGTGCLVGLAEQTIESLADDILFFKELNADMVGIGPFIAHPNTPLANETGNHFDMALKVSAITRLLMPDINISATSAMETLNPNGRIIALQSGANVVMPNITPQIYRSKYELYPGKICINDSSEKCMGCISGKIKAIGRSIAQSKGFRGDII